MTNIQEAVQNALAAQPWYVKRKDTLTAVAGAVLYLLDALAVSNTNMDETTGLALAAVVFVCQVFIHAGTKGAITESMATRLEDAAPEPEYANGLAVGAEAAELAGLPTANPHDEPTPNFDQH